MRAFLVCFLWAFYRNRHCHAGFYSDANAGRLGDGFRVYEVGLFQRQFGA